MSNDVSLTEFLSKVAAKDEEFILDQDCYHFFDWFCRDSALKCKFKTLSAKVKKIAKSEKIKNDEMYVLFENNCPRDGSLYDDIRFADLKTGDVIYNIVPKVGHNRNYGVSEVWGKENNFKEALVSGTWKDVLDFFGV